MSNPFCAQTANSPPYGGNFEEARLHLQLYKGVVFGRLVPVANMHGLHIGAATKTMLYQWLCHSSLRLRFVLAFTTLWLKWWTEDYYEEQQCSSYRHIVFHRFLQLDLGRYRPNTGHSSD